MFHVVSILDFSIPPVHSAIQMRFTKSFRGTLRHVHVASQLKEFKVDSIVREMANGRKDWSQVKLQLGYYTETFCHLGYCGLQA